MVPQGSRSSGGPQEADMVVLGGLCVEEIIQALFMYGRHVSLAPAIFSRPFIYMHISYGKTRDL